jgi:3-oxoadipate enol-lactonase
MPFLDVNNTRIHYDLTGPATAPILVFSNSLGTNFLMWDPQVRALGKMMRLLRYDTRGHGKTSTTPGPYSFDQLGRDALALVDALQIDHFSFCGLSMGGAIGMWLALNAPQRLRKLVLCSTSAKFGSTDTWNTRIAAVRKGGMKPISQAVMERWFTATYRGQAPDVIERIKRMVESTDPDGYIACCEALRDWDLRDNLGVIRTRTLVISGTHDPATPPSDGRLLAERIPGAVYLELDAAHLLNIEEETRFTPEVSKFVSD